MYIHIVYTLTYIHMYIYIHTYIPFILILHIDQIHLLKAYAHYSVFLHIFTQSLRYIVTYDKSTCVFKFDFELISLLYHVG